MGEVLIPKNMPARFEHILRHALGVSALEELPGKCDASQLQLWIMQFPDLKRRAPDHRFRNLSKTTIESFCSQFGLESPYDSLNPIKTLYLSLAPGQQARFLEWLIHTLDKNTSKVRHT